MVTAAYFDYRQIVFNCWFLIGFLWFSGATNRPQDLDKAIQRRMPATFHVPMPNETQRERILQLILKSEPITPDVSELYMYNKAIQLRMPATFYVSMQACNMAN